MAETKKMTKKEYFAQIREVVASNAELVAFVDHEIELLDRKNSSKGQTKTQIENETIARVIVEELAKIEKAVTITELMEQSEVIKNYELANGNHLTNQKISAILKTLVTDNQVIRTSDKKKTYFSVVSE